MAMGMLSAGSCCLQIHVCKPVPSTKRYGMPSLKRFPLSYSTKEEQNGTKKSYLVPIDEKVPSLAIAWDGMVEGQGMRTFGAIVGLNQRTVTNGANSRRMAPRLHYACSMHLLSTFRGVSKPDRIRIETELHVDRRQ